LYTLDKPRLLLKLGSNIQPDRKEQTLPEVEIIVIKEKTVLKYIFRVYSAQKAKTFRKSLIMFFIDAILKGTVQWELRGGGVKIYINRSIMIHYEPNRKIHSLISGLKCTVS
jgi:hypothetical protein